MKILKLAVLSIACAVIVTSCGGDATTKPTAAKTSAAPTPLRSSKPAGSGSKPGHGSGSGGSSRLELQEGITTQSDTDYTTSKFTPRATFHTPSLAYPFYTEQESPDVFEFGSEVGGLVVFRPEKVYDPSTGKLVALPNDLTQWATSNGHVTVGAMEPVKLAGVQGSQVTGVVTSVLSKEKECDAACLRLAPTGHDSVWFLKGDHFRLISLPVKGQTVGVVVYSDKAGFRQANSAATKLLKTLEFH